MRSDSTAVTAPFTALAHWNWSASASRQFPLPNRTFRFQQSHTFCILMCIFAYMPIHAVGTRTVMREATALARRAEKLGLSQVNIASTLRVSQAQISRVFSGRVKRRTRLMIDLAQLLDIANAETSVAAVRKNEALVSALAAVWDGTPEQARALAAIIRSVGTLQDVNASRVQTKVQ